VPLSDELAQWLTLREPADAAARSMRLARVIASRVGGREPVRILDLGTGTGSNIWYLASHLGGVGQNWLAIDRDPQLLARVRDAAASRLGARANRIAIETRERDLGSPAFADLVANRDLVTASALLDLVSDTWLRSLATACRTAGAAVLFAITYNGRSECSPFEPEDEQVLELFNRHQHRDKGLGGPAAGPDAPAAAIRAFTEAGYHVDTEATDWRLDPSDRRLQRELIEGWAYAATETDPSAAERIADWRARRLAHVERGHSQIVVGHDDLAAWLER
jgi:predicted nicotinamide N-methyase